MKPKISAFFTGTLIIQAAAAAAILGMAGNAQAYLADQYFSNAGGPYTWGTDNVWSTGTSGGPYSGVWGDWDNAIFEGTSGTVNVSGNQNVNSMTFNVDGYMFTGGTLTLGGASGGAPITVGAGLSATIQTEVLDTYTGMLKDGDGTLTLTGNVNLGSHALTINAGTLVLVNSFGAGSTTVNANGTLELSSTNTTVDNWTINSTFTGSGIINKTGTGWIQTASNGSQPFSFSGTVNVQEGTFGTASLQSDWSGCTADLNVSTGALLDARGQAITVGSLNGNGTVGTTYSTTSTVIVGVGDKSGSFAGVIAGNNTNLSTGEPINPNSGALNLVKTGIGTQTLSGANTYTGTTTIEAGTLKAGSGSAFPNNGALTLTGGTLDLNGYNAAFTGVTSATNAATITDSSAGSGTSTLTLNNAGAVGANIADGASRKVALRITNENGVFSLAGSNSFSGGIVLANTTNGTRMDAGITSGGAYGTGPITIGEAATEKAQIYFGGGSAGQTLSNHLIVNTDLGTDVDGTMRVECTDLTLSGTITANLADFQIGSYFSGRTVALTGPINGNSGLHVANAKYYGTAQNGAITVTLNNVGIENSYAGETTVDAYETLVLGSADQIPNGVGKGNVTVNGALNLGGNSETINGLSGAGTVDGGSSTLTLGDGDATGNFGGTITGLALTKIGSGTQTLAGSSTLNGITLTGGTLSLGEGSTAASFAVTADVIVDSGGTLNLNYSGTASINALWLGGVQKSPGVYGSGNSGGLITGTGTLTVTNGPFASDYDTWGSAYGLSAGSEGGDLDNDGLTNGEEHAFGLIPNSGSSVNPITSQLSKTSGQFSYQRRDNGLTGLTYTIWYSTDLATWTQDTGATEGTVTVNGDVETVPVTITNSLLTNPKLFIQVRAQ